MAQSRYKITKGKQNGYAEYPKTLVEAVYWDKKKKTLEEALEDIDADTATKLGQKMDKIANPSSGDFVAVDENGNAVSSGKKVSSFIPAPETPGTTGQVIQQNAQGKPEWVTPSAGTTPDSEMSDTSTNAVQNKVITAELEKYAKKDGYYGALTAGTAENLVGHGTVPAEYTHRTSGGSDDIGSGTAKITEIRGRSIVWNQLYDIADTSDTTTISDVTITDNRDGSYTLNGTASADISIQIGKLATIPGVSHKILFTGISGGSTDTFYIASGGAGFGNWLASGEPTILTSPAGYSSFGVKVNVKSGVSLTNKVIRPQFIDLTTLTMPDLTSPAFEALYPGFHGYNSGTLKSLTATGIKTTGFNLFNYATGKAVIPTPTNGNTTSGTDCIQISGTYTSITDSDGNTITPATGGYFNVSKATELTIVGGNNTDTCIHYTWSGYRNGEYEPYWSSELALPITTMTGKAGGVGDSVIIYPDGMMSAGTAYDYGRVDADGWWRKTQRVLQMVDISTLSWYRINGTTYMVEVGAKAAGTHTMVCSGFEYVANQGFDCPTGCITDSTSANYTKYIYVKTATSYESAAAFKSAVVGVMLIYQLATPVEYTLDEPVFMGYQVDDFGTETMLPDQTGLSEPTSAPIRYEVQYAMNAVDTLRRLHENYISADSLDNFAQALITAGIIGTYTRTFNSTTQEHDFEITAPEPDPEPEE